MDISWPESVPVYMHAYLWVKADEAGVLSGPHGPGVVVDDAADRGYDIIVVGSW